MKIHWIILSLIASFSFSFLFILATYATRRGVPVAMLLFVLGTMLSLLYAGQLIVTNQFKFNFPLTLFAVLIAAGIFSYIGNLTQFQATNDSPNPGLVISIVALNAGTSALLAVFFLKDKLNMLQIIGIIVGILAVILISLGSRNNTEDKVNLTKSITKQRSLT